MTEAGGYFAWPQHNATAALHKAAAFFHRNGYAVLTSHLTPSDVSHLLRAGNEIITDFQSDKEQQARSSIFTTDETVRKLKDKVFLDSASGVQCFLEESGVCADGKVAVNKIGHAMHDVHADFRRVSHSTSNRAVAAAVGLECPLAVQSMYIVKGADVGGAVLPHRDAMFVRPRSGRSAHCLGLWWALQDADGSNGCLRVVPRSHVDGRALGAMVLDGDRVKIVEKSDCEYEEKEYVELAVRAGDMVLLHGATVHCSARNDSGRSRHAYSIHVVEEAVADDCWLQRPAHLPFELL